MYIIETFQAGERGNIENIPALALDWLYRPAVAHIFLAHDAPSSDWDREVPQLIETLEGTARDEKQQMGYKRVYRNFLET
jgi:hypothetical protein